MRKMKIAYVDSQNIHKQMWRHGLEVDWKSFLKYCQSKYDIDRVKIFLWYLPKYTSFYRYLEHLWYIVVLKRTWILPDGSIKWNVDIDIAIHVLDDYYEEVLDQFILVSCDWDFASLVERSKKKNIFDRVMVADIQRSSKLLRKVSWSMINDLMDVSTIYRKKAI